MIRRHLLPIRALQAGKAATTRGRIVAQGLKTYAKRSKSVFEFVLEDGTGRLHCRWWNLPFMERYFEVGDDVMVFGKLLDLKPRTMDHPDTEILEAASDEAGERLEHSVHIDRVVPVESTREFVTLVRGAEYAMMDRTGHIGLVTQPEGFARIVGEFVNASSS